MQKKDKNVTILCICIIIILSLYIINDIFTVDNVDVDCLIDNIESIDLNNLSQYDERIPINEDWKIKDVKFFYDNKHPKSRWLLKSILKLYLFKCEK